MSFIIGLFIGLFIGGIVGFAASCFCFLSRRNEERAEKVYDSSSSSR